MDVVVMDVARDGRRREDVVVMDVAVMDVAVMDVAVRSNAEAVLRP
jgi:hypothetical protein